MVTLIVLTCLHSAAFDTVSHQKLLDILNIQFGIAGAALDSGPAVAQVLPYSDRPYVSCCSRQCGGIEHDGFGLWTARRIIIPAAEVDHLSRGATGYRQPSRNLISQISK